MLLQLFVLFILYWPWSAHSLNDHVPQITVTPVSDTGRFEVSRDTSINTVVAHVLVTDSDSGSNGKISCSLTHSLTKEVFGLVPLLKGEYKIVTTALLSNEDEIKYDLILTCHDHGLPPKASSASIHITILDVNDNHEPKFELSEFNAPIVENNNEGTYLVRVSATDPDTGLNGEIYYFLQEEDRDRFTIYEDSGVIQVKVALDYETEPDIHFEVFASDKGTPALTSSALVSVYVIDANDNLPVFDQAKYTFAIYENRPSLSEVGIVRATDKDSPPYDIIHYSLSSSDANNKFQIDQTSGQITTTQVLDYEEKETYHFEVEAFNPDLFPLSSTTEVIIYVGDMDD